MENRRRRHCRRRVSSAETSPVLRLAWSSSLVLVFFLRPAAGAAFFPATNYLLNCGGVTAVAGAGDDDRSFVPDSPSLTAAFSLSTHKDIFLSDPSPPPSLPPLYLTARVFTSPSSYTFPINGGSAAPLVVRLHFRPFASPAYNLSAAIFNVSASGSPLLVSFRPPATTAAVEEFLFWFDLPRLELAFFPEGDGGSALAFISAVEIFSAPASIFPSAGRQVSSAGVTTGAAVSDKVLQILHRVNAGGAKVTPRNDTLWRTWLPDGGYLGTPANQSRAVVFPGLVNYQDGGPTQEIAPNAVYGTAREMRSSGGGAAAELRNLSWICSVPQRRRYLLRLHFCDIVSAALYDLYFNVYIYGVLAMSDVDLSSLAAGPKLASPFYADFVIDAGGDGELQVTVGPSDRSLPSLANAILNGMEVMELIGPAKFTETGKTRRRRLLLLLGLILGSLFIFCTLVAVAAALVLRRRKQINGVKQSAAGATNPPAHSLNLGLKIPYSEIILATGNFSGENLIGAGGFGRVYKGILRDGTTVAVKRAVPGAGQGLPEFITEVEVLSQLRHRHLVSFIGYSTDRSELILVYEFMEEGSLRDHLYGAGRDPLPWKRRLEVCIGAAKGLHYLHSGATQMFIHRDVKSSNILLAGGGMAKIADFGLCKQAAIAGASQVITGVKGSFGYLDPEYLRTHQLTCKSDVYSFGVVLLEVLCGRPAIAAGAPWEQVNLAEWAVKRRREGQLEEIVDPAIRGSADRRSLSSFGDTAAACLAASGADRPTMADVLRSLEDVLRQQENQPHSDDGSIVEDDS